MIVCRCEVCGRELMRCPAAPRTVKLKPCPCQGGILDAVRLILKDKNAEIKRLHQLVIDLEDKLMREQTDGWRGTK